MLTAALEIDSHQDDRAAVIVFEREVTAILCVIYIDFEIAPARTKPDMLKGLVKNRRIGL